LADAIAECERQGTVVVAAAGNDGSESHTFQRPAKPSSPPAEWMPAGDSCRSRTGDPNTAVTGCWLPLRISSVRGSGAGSRQARERVMPLRWSREWQPY
jgi:hypothetical protein